MSQFSEDAHIEAVFNEIGFGSRVLVDIGARLAGSNSANLINRHGFTGTLVDASAEACAELEEAFPTCKVLKQTVRPEEVNEIVMADTWFLSIDVDSCDWWIWANVIALPALVVVETCPGENLFVAKMECRHKDPQGYGMTLKGARFLADAKGYDYIGRTEVNAFFVHEFYDCKYRLPEQKIHAGKPCGFANNVMGN
jgi:hypothetical protein